MAIPQVKIQVHEEQEGVHGGQEEVRNMGSVGVRGAEHMDREREVDTN